MSKRFYTISSFEELPQGLVRSWFNKNVPIQDLENLRKHFEKDGYVLGSNGLMTRVPNYDCRHSIFKTVQTMKRVVLPRPTNLTYDKKLDRMIVGISGRGDLYSHQYQGIEDIKKPNLSKYDISKPEIIALDKGDSVCIPPGEFCGIKPRKVDVDLPPYFELSLIHSGIENRSQEVRVRRFDKW